MRTHVAMPEQFLNRSDVVPGLEQMGRETVAKRMARGWTRNGRRPGRVHGPLEDGWTIEGCEV